MAKLNVNIDHIATIRQARGGIEPDPVFAAIIVELAGADGITIHLREDRRHIQDRDVQLISEIVKTKLNLEMAAVDEIINIALEIKPNWVTLVPEKRQELTTEGGLDVIKNYKTLLPVIKNFQKNKIKVSLFVDPDLKQIKFASQLGADFIEIHTGKYADAKTKKEENIEYYKIKKSAVFAKKLKLGVNAGHGLNYKNTARVAKIKEIEEFSIGHSIIACASLVGLDKAVRGMLKLVR